MPEQTPITREDLSAQNLRSFEGVQVAGGVIGPGRLWRSDNLALSPPDELARLHALGLRTVIDLRAPDEVEATGKVDWTGAGLHRLHRPMTRKAADPAALASTMTSIATHEDVGNWYLRLARSRADVVLRCLADIVANEGGVLFHCTAGKDRTGVLAAVVLLLLGTDERAIIDDYAMTGPAMDRVHRRHATATGRPMPSSGYTGHPLLHAHPDSMATFLREVRDAGGIDELLVTGATAKGVTDPRTALEHLVPALRDRLVVDA